MVKEPEPVPKSIVWEPARAVFRPADGKTAVFISCETDKACILKTEVLEQPLT
jgi:hypothetical protein